MGWCVLLIELVIGGEGFILFVFLKINDNKMVICYLFLFLDYYGLLFFNFI